MHAADIDRAQGRNCSNCVQTKQIFLGFKAATLAQQEFWDNKQYSSSRVVTSHIPEILIFTVLKRNRDGAAGK